MKVQPCLYAVHNFLFGPRATGSVHHCLQDHAPALCGCWSSSVRCRSFVIIIIVIVTIITTIIITTSVIVVLTALTIAPQDFLESSYCNRNRLTHSCSHGQSTVVFNMQDIKRLIWCIMSRTAEGERTARLS